MQFTFIDIVFLAVVISQLAIAIMAAWNGRNLSRLFSQPLGSKVTIVELLEKYSRVYDPVNIKVDARISAPAGMLADVLLINRRLVYSSGLYANFFVLFQIVLLQPAYGLLRRVHRLQIVLFLIEIALYVLHIYVYEPLGIVAAFLGVVLVITSVVYQSYLGDILDVVYDLSTDLLDLDEVERIRAKILIKELQSQAFVYAIDPVIWLVKFIVPIGSTP